MITIEGLKALGVDVETGLARCLDKEEFYLKLIDMGINDSHFEQLTELLRNKTETDYAPLYNQIIEMRNKIKDM